MNRFTKFLIDTEKLRFRPQLPLRFAGGQYFIIFLEAISLCVLLYALFSPSAQPLTGPTDQLLQEALSSEGMKGHLILAGLVLLVMLFIPSLVRSAFPFSRYILEQDKISGWGYRWHGLKSSSEKTAFPLTSADRIIIRKHQRGPTRNAYYYDIRLDIHAIRFARKHPMRLSIYPDIKSAYAYASYLLPQLAIDQTLHIDSKLEKDFCKEFPNETNVKYIEL